MFSEKYKIIIGPRTVGREPVPSQCSDQTITDELSSPVYDNNMTCREYNWLKELKF